MFVASTDYLSWMHNGIRQFIAVSMIFAAFPLQVKGKYWRFALVVLLASTIHGSALLMLPFAYIMTGPVLNRKTFLMIGGVALLIPFIDNFLPMLENLLMDTQYNDVMTNGIWESDDGTNLIRVLVYSVPALVALLGRKYIRRNTNPVTNLCINASMITMAIYLISSVTSGIYRWLRLRLPCFIHQAELLTKVNKSKHGVASLCATPCFFLVISERIMCRPQTSLGIT